MNAIKKVWNYKMTEEKRKTVRMRAVRALIGFLLLMTCATLVARAADSKTVAEAEAQQPKRQTLTHSVNIEGAVEAKGDTAVTAPSNMLVEEVAVEKGDEVKAGDLLFVFDTSEIEEQIAEKNKALKKQRLSINTMKENELLDEGDAEVGAQRAQEDYDVAVRDAHRLVEAAELKLKRAQQALDIYNMEVMADTYSLSQHTQLTNAVHDAARELSEAKVARDEALRKAQRELDDALKAPKADSSLALAQLEYRNIQSEIKALKAAVETGGEVYAPQDGIITDVKVNVGGRTGSDGLVYINDAQNMRFTAEITKEQKKHIAEGDKLGIQFPGDKQKTQLSVDSIESIPDSEKFKLTATLPEGVGAPGLVLGAEVRQKTQTHECCVPLSALYQESEKYYVMVVRSVETTLGTEYTAERVDVTLLDSNETMAAISGGITSQDRVITSSDRPLQDGDRIRVQEEQ